jgi:hypothetical protein
MQKNTHMNEGSRGQPLHIYAYCTAGILAAHHHAQLVGYKGDESGGGAVSLTFLPRLAQNSILPISTSQVAGIYMCVPASPALLMLVSITMNLHLGTKV